MTFAFGALMICFCINGDRVWRLRFLFSILPIFLWKDMRFIIGLNLDKMM